MNDTAATVQQMHDTWCQATGQQLLPIATARVMFELARQGVTADDIRCVVQHLQRFNAKSDGAKFRLNVIKVCGDPEEFAGLLGEARAAERNRRPAPTPRDQAQALRERPVDAEQSSLQKLTPAKSFKDVLNKLAE